MIGEDVRSRRSRATRLDLCPHTPFGTGDRVRVVFDGRYDLSQGLCNEPGRQAITLVETTYHYLDESKVFLLLIILQVVRMITTSKDGFLMTSQTLRFEQSERLLALRTWTLGVALKKIDSACQGVNTWQRLTC